MLSNKSIERTAPSTRLSLSLRPHAWYFFPKQIRASSRANQMRHCVILPCMAGTDPHHWVNGWAYGGSGYLFSAGILERIGRAKWKTCSERSVCGNSDMRAASCVFTHGYTLTSLHGKLGRGKPVRGIILLLSSGTPFSYLNGSQGTNSTVQGLRGLLTYHGIRHPEEVLAAYAAEQQTKEYREYGA